jgi:hypothetical protein
MKRHLVLIAFAIALMAGLMVSANPASVNAATPSPTPTLKPLFTDGRVNIYDATETATAYCVNYGDVQVWAVRNSAGYYAFTATKAELNAQPFNPATPTLIKQGLGVSLYRLPNGQLQINGPSPDSGKTSQYAFAWSGC